MTMGKCNCSNVLWSPDAEVISKLSVAFQKNTYPVFRAEVMFPYVFLCPLSIPQISLKRSLTMFQIFFQIPLYDFACMIDLHGSLFSMILEGWKKTSLGSRAEVIYTFVCPLRSHKGAIRELESA